MNGRTVRESNLSVLFIRHMIANIAPRVKVDVNTGRSGARDDRRNATAIAGYSPDRIAEMLATVEAQRETLHMKENMRGDLVDQEMTERGAQIFAEESTAG